MPRKIQDRDGGVNDFLTQTEAEAVTDAKVTGPGSATANALPRYDGTTGKLVKDSPVTVDDAGSVTLPANQDLVLSGGGEVLGLPTSPSGATAAASKAYVDAVAAGLDLKEAVHLATAAALPAYTPAGSGVGKTLTADANGALVVDGVTPSVGNRILVKDEGASHADHGIYTVTQVGDGGNPFILTRALDFDQDADVEDGSFCFVKLGNTLAGTGWVQTTNEPITVDTTALAFTQFSGATNGVQAFTGAGNPVGVVTPNAIGDLYVDTTNLISYINQDGTDSGWAVI